MIRIIEATGTPTNMFPNIITFVTLIRISKTRTKLIEEKLTSTMVINLSFESGRIETISDVL